MLFLLFQLGNDRYALDSARIAEVLPLVEIKQIPRAPAGIAGTIAYRGNAVPVVDLSELALGRPAQRYLSTRIVLVRYPGQRGAEHLLGLLAEDAIDTMRRDAADFQASGVTANDAPYLGPVASDGRGFVQWIEIDALLPASTKEALFAER